MTVFGTDDSRAGATREPSRKRRRPNPRLAKIHRNYTVDEIAALFGVHKNTVRQWIKQGLPVIDQRRPMLILGRELADFLQLRRKRNRRPCGASEIYCVKCRAPKRPVGNMAEYQAVTASQGNLVGMCPTCDTLVFRRVNLANLDKIRSHLDISLPKALRHISETAGPSVNGDFMGSR